MTRAARWLVAVLLGVVVVAAALLAAFTWLVPDDRTLALRIAAGVEEKYGVKLTVGTAHLKLWPSPQLTLENVTTAQEQPVSIRRLVAHLRAQELLRRKISIERIEIDGAVVPQLSLMRLRPRPAARGVEAPAIPPLRFHDLVWVTRYGKELPFEGNATFDPDARLRRVEMVRTGVQPGVQLTLARDGPDRWNVQLQIGGGTADGQVNLRRAEDGKSQLVGQLSPRGIEVASALDAFKAHSPVRGKASGQTQLSASGDTMAAMAASLHTRTTFSMSPATVLNIDVDKAIRSFGQDRAGQTALRSLSGRMDTQNTPEGMVVRYTGLRAQGQSFSATGDATIAKRHVDGKATVDLAGGLVGVPLKIAGPLGAPNVSVPTSALASVAVGAAIGTAVLPGIGTALGAKLGEMLGKPK